MLLLIDGSNLAHRAVYASFNELGYYCYKSAISHFIKRLAKTAEFHYTTAGVIVAWDRGIPLHRRELYSEYKPNNTPVGDVGVKFLSENNISGVRDETKVDFFETYRNTVKILHNKILPLIKCVSIRIDNVEADDIIAFCGFHLKGEEKQIISSDKDLMQLIDQNTSVYRFQNNDSQGAVYDYDWVECNYLDPTWFRLSFLIEKAILGDTSDNIPGIEFIGESTAHKYTFNIVKNMKDLRMSLNEAIYHTERPKGASKKGHESLRLSFDQIKRNLDLMDLYLPIYSNLDIVYNIQKHFTNYLNYQVDYEDSMDKLEEVPELYFNKCFSSIDMIFESNCLYDMKNILERLRDATSPRTKR